jgi:hypothetical protein
MGWKGSGVWCSKLTYNWKTYEVRSPFVERAFSKLYHNFKYTNLNPRNQYKILFYATTYDIHKYENTTYVDLNPGTKTEKVG